MQRLLMAVDAHDGSVAKVEDALGVNRKLAWRVYRIARAKSPMEAGGYVPARVSMHQLIKAAGRRRVDSDIVSAVSDSFDAFERFVERHAGDRSEFESLINSALPEEYEKRHLASREAIFRGAREVWGIAADAKLFVDISQPSAAAPDRLDAVQLHADIGLRWLRRDARLANHMTKNAAAGGANEMTTLDGSPIRQFTDVQLDRFCSDSAAHMIAERRSDRVEYVLGGRNVGTRSAMDLVYAQVLPAFRPRHATPERPTLGGAEMTEVPSRWNIFDLLVCEGVVPQQTPDARVYESTRLGGVMTRLPDREIEAERVAFDPPVRYMGRGLRSFRCLHVPRYEEMIGYLCEKRGIDPSTLHGYRLEVEYPVYSWQFMMTLKLPPKPEGVA